MQADDEHLNLQSERDQVGRGPTVPPPEREDWAHRCVRLAADPEAEDGQEADGPGGGGDRAPGAREEEAAEGPG